MESHEKSNFCSGLVVTFDLVILGKADGYLILMRTAASLLVLRIVSQNNFLFVIQELSHNRIFRSYH